MYSLSGESGADLACVRPVCSAPESPDGERHRKTLFPDILSRHESLLAYPRQICPARSWYAKQAVLDINIVFRNRSTCSICLAHTCAAETWINSGLACSHCTTANKHACRHQALKSDLIAVNNALKAKHSVLCTCTCTVV